MNSFVTEPERRLEIKEKYDLVVAGGGIAGISAALAAARGGAKTLLIEREFSLGGLATLGLVTIYLPLCDGKGRQVSFGIAEELFRLSVKYGAEANYPEMWLSDHTVEERAKGQRFEVRYDANVFAILCEQRLKEEGVDILYGTSVCSCDVNNGRINALIVENKSGRYAVEAGAVVDATGDADICAFSGEETVLYEPKNILAAWYYAVEGGTNKLHMHGFAEGSNEDVRLLSQKRFCGIDGNEISEMVQMAHNEILAEFLRKGGVSEEHSLSSIAGIPQLRMTRRLAGTCEMTTEKEGESIGTSVGVISNWKKRGPVYEVPFECLYGKKVKNLITAGRCISVSDEMWDISRVIPCCAVTGEAAGTAAAMTDDFSTLEVESLQSRLEAAGVKLHI